MNTSKNTLYGVLAGTAIGATLGVLFAPDKGTETRKKIAEKSNDLANEVAHSATKIKDQVANSFTSKSHALEEEVEALVTAASYEADEVIESLESKLKELKAKNRKLKAS